MLLNLSSEDLSDVLDALDTLGNDRAEQLRYTTDPEDRKSIEGAIERVAELWEKINEQKTEKENVK